MDEPTCERKFRELASKANSIDPFLLAIQLVSIGDRRKIHHWARVRRSRSATSVLLNPRARNCLAVQNLNNFGSQYYDLAGERENSELFVSRSCFVFSRENWFCAIARCRLDPSALSLSQGSIPLSYPPASQLPTSMMHLCP